MLRLRNWLSPAILPAQGGYGQQQVPKASFQPQALVNKQTCSQGPIATRRDSFWRRSRLQSLRSGTLLPCAVRVPLPRERGRER